MLPPGSYGLPTCRLRSVKLPFSSTAPVFMPPAGRLAPTSTTGAFTRNSRAGAPCSAPSTTRHHRRSGILINPTAARLARLQRLHRRDEAREAIRRLVRTAHGQGQHEHRTRGPGLGARRRPRRDGPVFRRWRFPVAGGGRAAPWRARDHGIVSTIERRPPAVAVRLPARRTSSPTWSSLEPSSIGIGPVVRPHASAAMLLVRRCGAPPLRGRVRSPTNSFPNSWRVPEWDFGLPTFVHYFATATSNA
ncbi:hypothetical protein ACVWW5_002706 [Bradyrhizobium sp. LM3.4]